MHALSVLEAAHPRSGAGRVGFFSGPSTWPVAGHLLPMFLCVCVQSLLWLQRTRMIHVSWQERSSQLIAHWTEMSEQDAADIRVLSGEGPGR